MELIHEQCAGLDVHKKFVTVCIRIAKPGQPVATKVRTFGTMTPDLRDLAVWLQDEGCRHAVMESTGVYWKPVYHILGPHLDELVLANAKEVKHLPGRKTDVKDAVWLAELYAHGLLNPSFVPSEEQRALRDLTRDRAQLIAERSRMANRIQKVLEDANIKLSSVATDIMGASGRAMLTAIVDGTTDPEALANMAKGRLRNRKLELVAALSGRLTEHHRFLLRQHLAQVDFINLRIDEYSREIENQLRPFEEVIERLDSIPGWDRRAAEVFAAEIGLDLSRFPTAGHLASYCGLCPGHNQSGGKHRSGKIRKGSRWLRSALCQSAWAGARTKNSYLNDRYHRLAARRGKKRAIIAIAHDQVVSAYYMITRNVDYQDLGRDYYERRSRERLEKHLVARLRRLGHDVILTPTQPETASV
jgi:transposase